MEQNRAMSSFWSIDSRDKSRGGCLESGCVCSCYTWNSGSHSYQCTKCNHLPGKHKLILHIQPIDTSEEDCEAEEVEPVDSMSETFNNKRMRLCVKLAIINGGKLVVTKHHYFVLDVIPDHLRCLGCGRMKFDKGDGTYFDYCGRTCRNAHLQGSGTYV